MIAAYETGDPYLAFARQAGAIPADAVRADHEEVRGQFKQCALAVQYGQGVQGLATRIGQPPVIADALLHLHRRTFATYWRWTDGAADRGMLTGTIANVFGWPYHVPPTPEPRDLSSLVRRLRNFPAQANGSAMMQMAATLATERSIRVCAPIHDAFCIEASAQELDAAVEAMQEAMAEASEIVLGGFRLRTEAKVVRWPDRYSDPGGEEMWNRVWSLIEQAPEGVGDSPSGVEANHLHPCRRTTHTVPSYHSSLLSFSPRDREEKVPSVLSQIPPLSSPLGTS